jgi:hypothetical protein
MHVGSHGLFDTLLGAAGADVEASITFSLATPPALSDFLDDLDPGLPLDWSGGSFLGHAALRARIVDTAGLAPVLGPDQVMISGGAAEANFLALARLLRRGDEVVVEQPGWLQPLVLAPALGARVVEVARRADDAWRLDAEELLGAITPATRVVFLTNPSNPTGQLLGADELEAIAARADQVGAWLLIDEVYAGLEWDGPRAASAATLSERGITTGSVSKALGLQGLRIGWLATRDGDLLHGAVVLRETTSEIPNVLGETVAEIALRPERLGSALARAREEGRANLELLDAFVAGRPELDWSRPRGGLVGLCRVEAAVSADEIAARLLRPPYRTLVVPGSAFGCPDHLRLGAGGGPQARLELGLDRLGALLDEIRRDDVTRRGVSRYGAGDADQEER